MTRALVLAVLAIAVPAIGPAAQRNSAPWVRVLWLHGGPPRGTAFFTAVKELGFNAVSVSALEDPAVPGAHGLAFYRDQVAGKGILELPDAAFAACRDGYERDRGPEHLVRPACLSHDDVLERLAATISARLEPALEHGPLAASLGDEVSVTTHGNPLDFCFDPACLRAFRSWLRNRHGDLAGINLAWGTDFVRIGDVVPFTADRIRSRELGHRQLPRNLAPWGDHLAFKDWQLAHVVERATRQVNVMAPGLPCGLTGMQPPTAYGGHDYRLLMPHGGFYEAYDIGGARDLAMSLAPANAFQFETVAAPRDGEPARIIEARLFDLLAHGMRGVVVWSAAEVLTGGREGEVEATPFGRELAAAFEAMARPAAVVAGARLLRDPVWIVESRASVRAHWMLDSIADGQTWVRRTSSYEVAHSTSMAARLGWLRLFEDLGLQPRFVDARDLAARLQAGGRPRLIVLPAAYALPAGLRPVLDAWVRGGGVLVADHGPGLYDEHLKRRPQGLLDELFGVRARSFALRDLLVREGEPDPAARLPSGAAAAELGVRGSLAEQVGDLHVQMERALGKGRAFYLNLAVCEYRRVRLDPDRVRAAFDLRRRVRPVLAAAGIAPPVLVAGRGLPTCLERMRLRTRDGRLVLAIRLNALDDPGLVQKLGERGPCAVELAFPRALDVRDLWTGERHRGVRHLSLALDPWRGLMLEIEED